MQVYVTQIQTGAETLGVFSTLELAQQAVAQRFRELRVPYSYSNWEQLGSAGVCHVYNVPLLLADAVDSAYITMVELDGALLIA